jgi:hypothetical protein
LNRTVRSPLQNVVQPPASNKDVVLSGIIPHLQFTLEIQSNNLTYQGNTYTKYQQFLYDLCKQLHDKGYGYRRIAKMFNKWGLQTPRGNTFFNTSISSILKRKHQRDARIQDVRNRKFAIKIGKFSIKYFYL